MGYEGGPSEPKKFTYPRQLKVSKEDLEKVVKDSYKKIITIKTPIVDADAVSKPSEH